MFEVNGAVQDSVHGLLSSIECDDAANVARRQIDIERT